MRSLRTNQSAESQGPARHVLKAKLAANKNVRQGIFCLSYNNIPLRIDTNILKKVGRISMDF